MTAVVLGSVFACTSTAVVLGSIGACAFPAVVLGSIVACSSTAVVLGSTAASAMDLSSRWSHTTDLITGTPATGSTGSALGLVDPVSVYCDWVK